MKKKKCFRPSKADEVAAAAVDDERSTGGAWRSQRGGEGRVQPGGEWRGRSFNRQLQLIVQNVFQLFLLFPVGKESSRCNQNF